jgi:uncharacterized membrane protein
LVNIFGTRLAPLCLCGKMNKMEEKNLQLERLVFFSDAVIAIAITLLALDIRIEKTESGHLSFEDIFRQWHVFLSFFLSFFNIANFWRTHHRFFVYINRINDTLLTYNILWLLFIVLLPFATSLVSNYFFDGPAIFIYCLVMLIISIFQNMIWDYSAVHQFIDREKLPEHWETRIRAFCNLDMINSGLALLLAHWFPTTAFIILFTKFPTLIIAGLYFGRKRKEFNRKDDEALNKE